MVRTSLPVAVSHTLRVRSSAVPETRYLLSGLKFRAVTVSPWPVIVNSSLPVATSHSRTARSAEPDAISLPSGLRAQDTTSRVWPYPGDPSRPTSSQILTVLSTPADASRLPLGLNATELIQ